MNKTDFVKKIIAALSSDETIKSFSSYQNGNAVQILTNDGTLFNVFPVDVTNKALNLCKQNVTKSQHTF